MNYSDKEGSEIRVFTPLAPHLSGKGHIFFTRSLGVPSTWDLGNSALLMPWVMWKGSKLLPVPSISPLFHHTLWYLLNYASAFTCKQSLQQTLLLGKEKRSHICMIHSSWVMSLCVKEVSKFISRLLAADKHVRQWCVVHGSICCTWQTYRASFSTRYSTW